MRECIVCKAEIKPPDMALVCDRCNRPYHAESCGDEWAIVKGSQRCDDCKGEAKRKESTHA